MLAKSNGAAPARPRRREAVTRIDISTAQVIELENSTREVSRLNGFKNFTPVFLWGIWILGGAIFYSVHDGYGFVLGLYMSVNVGWSMGWAVPVHTAMYNTLYSKIFSSLHASFGVVFVGVAVIFIAQQLTRSKDSWIIQMIKRSKLEAAAETEEIWDDFLAAFHMYFPKFKIIILFLLWILTGLVCFRHIIPRYDYLQAADFMVSCLSGGGYKTIPDESPRWKFLLVAIYSAVGVPLMAISLGLLLSIVMEPPEDQSIYEKIVASVTQDELDFMKIFGIDDGDGIIDNREFIILTVVRIGAAPPELVQQINERFRVLDRRHEGRISYDDLVYGRKKKLTSQKSFRMALGRTLSNPGLLTRQLSSKMTATLSRSGIYNRSDSKLDPDNPSRGTSLGRQLSSGVARGVSSISLHSLNSFSHSISHTLSSRHKECRVLPVDTASDIETGKQQGEIWRSSFDDDAFRAVDNPSSHNEEAICSDTVTNFQGGEDEVVTAKHFGAADVRAGNGFSKETAAKADDSTLDYTHDQRPFHGAPIDSRGTATCDASASAVGSQVSKPSDWTRLGQDDGECALALEDMGDSDDGNSDRDVIHGTPRNKPPFDQLSHLRSNGGKSAVRMAPTSFTAVPNEFSGKVPPPDNDSNLLDRMTDKESSKRREVKRGRANLIVMEKIKAADTILSLKSQQHLTLTQKTASHIKILVSDPYFQSFLAWFTWLMSGTLFYSLHVGVGFAKGLYLSVAVGYGIFWWPFESDPWTKAYTTMHLLFGSAAIASAMAVFARSLVNAKNDWYVEAMRKKELADAADTEGYMDDIVAAFRFYGPKLKVHFLFLLWIVIGIVFSCSLEGWPLVDGIYFAVSTMATGGMRPISADSPDWAFVFVALYVVSGVPIMAIALGITAHMVATLGGSELLQDRLSARITDEELDMMKEFGMEDGDGYVDPTEFAILMLVRIEALPPDLITVINERFEALDVDKIGSISYNQLKKKQDVGSAISAAHHLAESAAAHNNRLDGGATNRRFGFGSFVGRY